MGKRISMLAAENGALAGGKVGGLADVVRELPRALAKLGHETEVISPSYGFLHVRNKAVLDAHVEFPFGGKTETAEVWRVSDSGPQTTMLLIEHPALRGEPIYYNDPSSTPYMRDAEKFALFCSAAGRLLCNRPLPSTIHVHDWHAAPLFLLRALHPSFAPLAGVHTAFTIHNIGIQGTRPMRGPVSALDRWFPELFERREWMGEWSDDRYGEPSFNPLAVGVRRADAVNTVSPGYASEILRPSDHPNGFFGGEGLEGLLAARKNEGKLFGILNGCAYPAVKKSPPLTSADLVRLASRELTRIDTPFARLAVERLRKTDPDFVMTSVGRIVDQKSGLLFERTSGGETVIDAIGRILEQQHGLLVIVGTGVRDMEERLLEACRNNSRIVFVNTYAEELSEALYAAGTIFLMPSLYEPCGISQMIAMREGQPCVVHAVGGLKDTVKDGVTGFSFAGPSLAAKADGCVDAVERAVTLYRTDRNAWKSIREAAMAERWTWESSARQYAGLLYA